MATVLTINGLAVDPVRYNLRLALSLRFDAYSSLTIERRGGTLPASPDPWLCKPVTLSVNGATVFKGDIWDRDLQFSGVGWNPTYAATDLKARADRIPFTDANTGTDAAAYNMSPEDPQSIVGRQGRNVGQILTDALSGLAMATALQARGIGNYLIAGGTVTLPTATLTDLAAMTIVPPRGSYIGGERAYSAVAAFCREWTPNHLVWIDPASGNWRFFDKRAFTPATLTMGTDPIMPTPLSRRLSECFSKVIVRGQPLAEPKLVSLQNTGLQEDFAWGTYATSADAKAAWTPAIAQQDTMAKDSGSCSVPSTTTVTITASDDAARHWIANYWDQTVTGVHGVVHLFYSAGTDINMFVSRRIIANTALTAGGTCTLTLDLPLPATNYTKYLIYGLTSGAGFVYEKYKVTDPLIAAALAKQFTYPQPFVNANGSMATLTSYPMASVCWSSNGLPPYNENPIGITIDPTSGHIYTLQPTYVVAGGHDPSDVRALLAVNTGALTTTKPAAGYEGTSYTVDGNTETLVLTIGQWRDPLNQSAMDAYAQEVLDSVKDAVIEGDITYLGLYAAALTPGVAINVAGNGYVTEWGSARLPVLSADLAWSPGNGLRWTTNMHCSNRRAALSSDAFMKPDRLAASALAMIGGDGHGPGNIMARAALMNNPQYLAAMAQMANAQSLSDVANAHGRQAAADAINRQASGPGDAGQGGDEGGMALPDIFGDQPDAPRGRRAVSQADQVARDEAKQFDAAGKAIERATRNASRSSGPQPQARPQLSQAEQMRRTDSVSTPAEDAAARDRSAPSQDDDSASVTDDAARDRSAPDQGDA